MGERAGHDENGEVPPWHRFVDTVTGETCGFHPESMAVEHDGCNYFGQVIAGTDGWFCTKCNRAGRINGTWAVALAVAAGYKEDR